MSSSIGNLAVTLSLDAIAFTQGLDNSAAKANTFAAGVAKTFAGISAATAIGGEIGGIAKGFYDGFKDGISEIVRTGQEAHRLGVSLEGLAGIQLLAGNDAEKMDHALMHMSRTLSEAAQGGMEAKSAFQELHLDASNLAKLPLDQSLGKIVDAVNELGSAADRTNAGMKLWGREGVDILEKLRGGSIGIAEAIAKIQRHGGVGFTEKDVANAIEAERSIKEMESTFSRVKLMLVSEFAPVVKNVADWVADLAGPVGGGLRKVFHDAAVSLVDGMGTAVEGSEKLVIAAHRMEASFNQIGKVAGAILSVMAVQFDKSGAKADDDFEREVLRQGQKFRDALNASRAGLADMGGSAGGAGGLDSGGGATLDTFAGKIGALENKLRAATAAFGLTGDAAERFALAGLGASNAQLAVVDAQLADLKKLKEASDSPGVGLNIFDKFADRKDRLKGVFSPDELAKEQADRKAQFQAGFADLQGEVVNKQAGLAAKLKAMTTTDRFKGFDTALKAVGGDNAVKGYKDALGGLETKFGKDSDDFLKGRWELQAKLAKTYTDKAAALKLDAGAAGDAFKDLLSGMNPDALRDYAAHLDTLGDKFKGLGEKGTALANISRNLADEMEKAARAEVAQLTESAASPIDKLQAHFRALEEEKKKFGLSDDAFNAAIAKDFKGIGGEAVKIEHPGAALEGSTQAYESILNFEDQGKQGDVQERTAAAVERLEKQQIIANRVNQQVADAINRIFKRGV